MKKVNLKPCPFCGGEAWALSFNKGYKWKASDGKFTTEVFCTRCRAKVEKQFNDAEQAIRNWNTRNLPMEFSLIEEPDLSTCPRCGGIADNGHDREYPPNPYVCTKCEEFENAK